METQILAPDTIALDDHRPQDVHTQEIGDHPTPTKEEPTPEPAHSQDETTLEADTVIRFREAIPGIKRLSIPLTHIVATTPAYSDVSSSPASNRSAASRPADNATPPPPSVTYGGPESCHSRTGGDDRLCRSQPQPTRPVATQRDPASTTGSCDTTCSSTGNWSSALLGPTQRSSRSSPTSRTYWHRHGGGNQITPSPHVVIPEEMYCSYRRYHRILQQKNLCTSSNPWIENNSVMDKQKPIATPL